MVELAPCVGHPHVSAGDLDAGLVPVLRSPGLAGQAALFPLEFLLGPAQEARGVDLRAVGEDREVPQAQVDADGGCHVGQRFRVGLHDEGREVSPGSVFDHGDRGRHGGETAGPRDPHVADLRQGQVPAGRDLPPGVRGEPYGLPVVLAGFEPGRSHARALALQAVEEVPVCGIQVPEGLLEDDGGHLAQPCALFGELGLGDQQLGQVPGLRERLACGAGGLTGAKRIVVDHPRAPERPGQRGALRTVRIQAEAVPQLHTDHATTVGLWLSIRTFVLAGTVPSSSTHTWFS